MVLKFVSLILVLGSSLIRKIEREGEKNIGRYRRDGGRKDRKEGRMEGKLEVMIKGREEGGKEGRMERRNEGNN